MLPQPFPVFRSVLRSDALVPHVLALYALGEDVICTLHTRGINDVYFVESSAGRWVLRVTNTNGQTPAAVQSEIDMLRHLVQSSVAEVDSLPVFAALRQLFLFGAAIEYAPGFGVAWMTGEWFARMVAFIRACQEGDWLARVGLG
jgi:hypothetical protein